MTSDHQSNRSKFENPPPNPTSRYIRRARRILFVASIPIIVFAVLVGNFIRTIETSIPILDPKILASAISAYRQDCINRDVPIPNEVSLTQMIRWGYLEKTRTENSAVDEIYFNTNLKGYLLPQAIVCRTEFLDGEQIVLLGDGSVQKFSAERFRSLTRDGVKASPDQEF